MTQQMPNDEIDTALILEGELKRRVSEVVGRIVEEKVINMVGKIIQDELSKYKAETMMEVSINVGKMLKMIENESRKPLWETDLTEFGLTKEQLNSHMLGDKDALRQQTQTL